MAPESIRQLTSQARKRRRVVRVLHGRSPFQSGWLAGATILFEFCRPGKLALKAMLPGQDA
jgi:hypothetical protein